MTADNGTFDTEAPAYGAGTTPDTLKDWLRAHRIEEIDCAVPDIAGVARGKTMPAEKFVKLDPVHLPISIFHQTITGDYVGFEEDGQQLYAESDLMMVPDLSTIRPAPWASSPTAQVIHDATWQNGDPVEIAPRQVLRRIVELFLQRASRTRMMEDSEARTRIRKAPGGQLDLLLDQRLHHRLSIRTTRRQPLLQDLIGSIVPTLHHRHPP